MPSFNAISLMRPNEKSLVVFTRGNEFKLNKNGTGTTGHWVCATNKLKNLNSVIVYSRDRNKRNFVFKVDITGIVSNGNRHLISFTNCTTMGETDLNWYQFTNSSSNLVKYLSN